MQIRLWFIAFMTIMICAIGFFGVNGGGLIQILLLLLIAATSIKIITARINF